MNTETLNKIADLTEVNNHTEARIIIAKQFPYLAQDLEALQAVKTIHNIEGSLPYGISQYRDTVTKHMLVQIEKIDGKDTAHAIERCI